MTTDHDRLVTGAQEWLDLAEQICTLGACVGDMLRGCRDHLRAVPDPHRAQLLLPVGITLLLVGNVAALLPTD